MLKKYQKLSVIGSGSFGKAWLVTQAGNAMKMVCKEVKVTKLTEKESEQCITEVMVLAQCNHGNIIRYIEAFVEDRHLHIVMEYADGGDLQRKIFKQNGIYFAKEIILDWFVQIMLALEYIHSRNILHRDLKSQNVFLTGSDIIKLGDFGIAKILHGQEDHALTTIGTPFYISPEICQKKPYNSSSDMWAAGCLLFEMCLLRMPFNAPDFTSLVLKILQGDYDPIPSYFGPLIQRLVSSLLLIQPSTRISASEVLKIPEVMVILKRLQLKHDNLYKGQRSRSPCRAPCRVNRQESDQRSVSPCQGLDKKLFGKALSNDNTENKLNTNVKENERNKVTQLRSRCPRDRLESVHNVRSLTPGHRRGHKVERQHSEPRRYSCGDGKERKATCDNLVDYNDNCGNKQTEHTEKQNIKVHYNETESNVDKTYFAEVSYATKPRTSAVTQGCNGNPNYKASPGSKKTYVIKESALRRLSQVSPLLNETVRQQRASLSLDQPENYIEKVEPPKSVLFRNENVAPIFPSDPTETDTCIVADTLDGSQDEVFDTKDNNVHTETRKDMDEDGGEKEQKAGEKIPRMIEYETGPFPVQLQKNRIDSTTYVVRKAASLLNNNDYTDRDQDVNEILFLAASVGKQHPETAKDILNNVVVNHLGPEMARKIISMVTKHIDSGQSYQSLKHCLYGKEMEVLPLIISMYNLQ